ncbi:HIT family protein [candidate division KSB1 bacterium]
MNDLFLKIIKGEIPSEKIYEDDKTYAFLDINPNNPGHTLVIPKESSRNIFDIKEEDWQALMETVRKLAPSIKEAMQADGINIHMNNEPAAFQEVFHTHIHIIPRFKDDGFKPFGGTPYKEGEEKRVGEKIRSIIAP